MGLQIYMQGQDITAYVSEPDLDIQDTLGQGAGVGGGSSGRATQATLKVSLMGPAASAVGAGTPLILSGSVAQNANLPTARPKLIRMGEVIIYDASGTIIFGGYATQLEDKTEKKNVYVQVDCTDYWQFLTRIIVNEVYDGQSDIFIVKDLLTKYAPWISQSLLGTTANYTFGPENYQHWTLQKALQRVADKVGFSIWIDPNKRVHYINPVQSQTAPFGLSDTPDFSLQFPCNVTQYTVDDEAAINRTYFYGGKHLSDVFTQDLSIQCNGVNDIFTLAYYPHKCPDGKFHLVKNGHDYASEMGFVGGDKNSDKLIRDGGTATVLLNIDSHVILWNTAPAGGATVTMKYCHEIPLVVTLVDKGSLSFYGMFLDGIISDSSVFDTPTAIKRCRTLLLEQAYGLTTLQVTCWRPGLQAGQVIRIDHRVKEIHDSFIIQEVHALPKGAGFFEYQLTLGAWNWSLVDLVQQLAKDNAIDDTTTSGDDVTIAVETVDEDVAFHDAWTTLTRTMGDYFARDTPVGDGHDAYAGLSSAA